MPWQCPGWLRPSCAGPHDLSTACSSFPGLAAGPLLVLLLMLNPPAPPPCSANNHCRLYESWLICEHCERGSLADVIANGQLSPADPAQRNVWVVLCLLDIALGLDYLHSSTIVSARCARCDACSAGLLSSVLWCCNALCRCISGALLHGYFSFLCLNFNLESPSCLPARLAAPARLPVSPACQVCLPPAM